MHNIIISLAFALLTSVADADMHLISRLDPLSIVINSTQNVFLPNNTDVVVVPSSKDSNCPAIEDMFGVTYSTPTGPNSDPFSLQVTASGGVCGVASGLFLNGDFTDSDHSKVPQGFNVPQGASQWTTSVDDQNTQIGYGFLSNLDPRNCSYTINGNDVTLTLTDLGFYQKINDPNWCDGSN